MIHFRPATLQDIDQYYEWVNEKSVRESSFYSEPIPYEDHCRWFKEKLASPNVVLLLFFEDEKAIGQVRFEREGEHAVTDISIDKSSRGQGYGKIMLNMAADFYFSMYQNDALHAYIKTENSASIRSFQNAGFNFTGESANDQKKCLCYVRKNAGK